MTIHFEQLWEECEEFNKIKNPDLKSSGVIDELSFKISLYQKIEEKSKDIPKEELERIRNHTLGEILFTITSISFADQVNVFDALNTALQHRKIEHFKNKYSK